MWPPDDDLLDVWRRSVAEPLTAGGAFAAAVLPPLEADLARGFARVDPHLVTEAADCAVLALLRTPAAYDPARAPLPAFLRMAARRDLVNLLAKEGRHHRGRTPWAAVELGHPARNESADAPTLADFPALADAVAGLSAEDRCVLDLILDGERDTAVFAAALGLADRPAAEQVDAVKRAKDRVKARVKRAGSVS